MALAGVGGLSAQPVAIEPMSDSQQETDNGDPSTVNSARLEVPATFLRFA